MNDYRERIKALHGQILEKKRIEAEIISLESQEAALDSKIFNLDYARKKEQSEFESMESGSISAFLYRLIGKYESKLDKEKREAIAAQAKYEAASHELEAIRKELDVRREKMKSLRQAEFEYSKLINEKRQSIRNGYSPASEALLKLEAEKTEIGHRIHEIDEAIHAGTAALNTAASALASLDSADGMATWDMLGGGFIADVMKHSNLDDAQDKINSLQLKLDRFRTELADVSLDSGIQVNIDGFMRFADYFFDGFFVDWAVKDRIHQSINSVSRIKSEIETLVDRLDCMRISANNRLKQIESEIETLIRNA
ncbi:MAG: hypothetical protein E7337_04145 [Clostridiales bacterium]|nr:hypothetical protein [Clostridiales bacterium]